MKIAIDFFVDSFLMVLVTAVSVYVIAISLMTADARNFHSTSIAKIEASDGSELVIRQCVEEAKTRGYEMKVVPACLYEDHFYYYVTVDYSFRVPVSRLCYKGTVEGYAR